MSITCIKEKQKICGDGASRDSDTSGTDYIAAGAQPKAILTTA